MTLVAQLVPNIIGGVAVLLLAYIARSALGLRRDFHRFMGEHMWLIATSLWTRDTVLRIMETLKIEVEHAPPENLPPRR